MGLLRLQEDFKEYAEKVKTLPENKLTLYGLYNYKQATVGEVNTCTILLIALDASPADSTHHASCLEFEPCTLQSPHLRTKQPPNAHLL